MPALTVSSRSKLERASPDDDPLTRALAPPWNESPAERDARLRNEAAAKAHSDAIDADLEKQRATEKRGPKPLKVLLLGQSESGKSTTLKNFQLMCEPKAFRNERASWRAVIQLNVVRSMHLILDAMNHVQNAQKPSPDPENNMSILTPELLQLKMRLLPLLQIEETLVRKLNPTGSLEYEPKHLASDASSTSPLKERSRNVIKEVAVYSTTQWKGAFTKIVGHGSESLDIEDEVDWDDPKEPGVFLSACSEDMITLWHHPVIKELLEKQSLRPREQGGFFLDELQRVTAIQYMPTDDDILRARLKTLGVSEHRFQMISAAWVPFFDDLDAIIFLAPISCFDQVLAEDPKVNRLEDSFNLWTSIVSNPILKDTNLILFLNKIDILKLKLASGITLKNYVVSYADRPNDFENASAYFKKKFAGILKAHSPVQRIFYCHLTSVTDTKSTKYILSNINDMLMRQNLVQVSLMI